VDRIPGRDEITRLLAALAGSEAPDGAAREAVIERLYPELRSLAGALMARERAGHTLQPTALVHEAWLRLVDVDLVSLEGRAHFFGIAARCMRQVLVDHARARSAGKRGGDQARVTLEAGLLASEDPEFELIALDSVLSRFETLDPRAARVAEMRLFAGMTIEEIASDLQVSPRTVDGDWATARMWISRELSPS
jgi:RNA polymerase sigma-70 factor (ECF subfamily)